MSDFFDTAIALLGWPLLHFIWQGALIGCLLATGLVLLRNASAQARYALAGVAMLACLGWPTYGVVRAWQTPEPLSLQLALQWLDQGQTLASVTWLQSQYWLQQIQSYLPLLVFAWLCGMLVMCVRLSLGLLWLKRLADSGYSANQLNLQHWQHYTRQQALGMGIQRRQVQLRIVEDLHSPITLGNWQPFILLPASLVSGMPADLLKALIAHEIAHIKRWDYAANLAQNLVLALLFYHPVVWWIARVLEKEREQIADALAADYLGQPRQLALALQQLDVHQRHQLAAAANGGDLLSRIRQLVKPGKQAWRWQMAHPMLMLGVISCLSLSLHWQVQAQQDKAITAVATQRQPEAPAKEWQISTFSEHVLVVDEQSGKILLHKNADQVVPIASISKLITAWVILKSGLNLQEQIKITKADMISPAYAASRLRPGMVLSRAELLELSLVPSDNSAAKALGRSFPGGLPAFVAQTQRLLKSIGANQTNIAEPSGISRENVSSAADLVVIAAAAAKQDLIREWTSSAQRQLQLQGRALTIENTNPMVTQQDWDVSLSKTGFNKEAGRCVLMRFHLNGRPVIMALLNADNNQHRSSDAEQVRNYVRHYFSQNKPGLI